jgi:ribosomal protein S18 acetylase RimI-like enzyme
LIGQPDPQVYIRKYRMVSGARPRCGYERIVGAIGPMHVLPDSWGRLRLLPQYLAVLPAYRGRGFGRELWRAARKWGQRHGAVYQLLQARCDTDSKILFLTEGFTTLGFIDTTT